MNDTALKIAIAEDIQTLKTFSAEIMPARQYYQSCFAGFFIVYGLMVAVGLLACILPLSLHAWNDYFRHEEVDVAMVKMVFGCIFAPCFFMIFLYGKVKTYVLFKHQISPYLKTGQLFLNKMQWAAKIALSIYTFFTVIFIFAMDPSVTFFAQVGSFIFSAIGIGILIDLEVSRIGLSAFTDAVSHYFDKDKKRTRGAIN